MIDTIRVIYDVPQEMRGNGATFPLSYQQIGQLAMERAGMARYLPADGRPHTANLYAALLISGPFSFEVVERTLQALLRRHDALRTRLTTVNGAIAQTFEPAGRLAIEMVDVTGIAGEIDARIRPPALEAMLRPFDYFSGPMLRTLVVKLEDDRHAIVLVLPHLVSDGWSIEVLAEEFRTIYESIAADQPVPLPEPTFLFPDFLSWQRACLRDKAAVVQRYYDRTMAAGDWSFISGTRTNGQGPSAHATDVLWFELGAERSSALPLAGRRHGVSEFMVLLAALNMALVRTARGDTPLVHVLFGGRTHPPMARTVGLFSNLCAVPTGMHGATTPGDVLRRVRQAVLETQVMQWIPREALNEIARARGQALPWRSVVLNYLAPSSEPSSADPSPTGERRWRSFSIEIPPHVATRLASFDVGLWITRNGDGTLRLRLFYRRSLLDADSMAAFGSCVLDMTDRIVQEAH